MKKAKKIFHYGSGADMIDAARALLRGEAIAIVRIPKPDCDELADELKRITTECRRRLVMNVYHDAACPVAENLELKMDRCLCEHVAIHLEEI